MRRANIPPLTESSTRWFWHRFTGRHMNDALFSIYAPEEGQGRMAKLLEILLPCGAVCGATFFVSPALVDQHRLCLSVLQDEKEEKCSFRD